MYKKMSLKSRDHNLTQANIYDFYKVMKNIILLNIFKYHSRVKNEIIIL